SISLQSLPTRRSSDLYLINYFKEALKGNGKVFATDMQLTAPALVDADVAIQVPAIYSDEYIPSLLNIIEGNNINCVISLNDLELDRNSTRLNSSHVKI